MDSRARKSQPETETYTTSDWDGAAEDSPPRDPVLEVRVLPDGAHFKLAEFLDADEGRAKKWISIGSRPDNDIQLIETLESGQRRTVSTDHCELCRTPQGRVLVRRWPGARNSTKVNGIRVRDGFVELGPGDVLRVGRMQLVALSAEVRDVIKITADSPGDYLRRALGAWGTLERVGDLFDVHRSTVLRWLRNAGLWRPKRS